jgi:hypothetical protein
MNAFEAITFARKHLSEHFNLTLLIDAQDGRHVGRMHGHNEAADAYNALAKLHTMIDESGNFRKSRRSSR